MKSNDNKSVSVIHSIFIPIHTMKKFCLSVSLVLSGSSIVLAQKPKEVKLAELEIKKNNTMGETNFVSFVNESNVKTATINTIKLNDNVNNNTNFRVGKEKQSYFEIKTNTENSIKEKNSEACDMCQGKVKNTAVYNVVKQQLSISSPVFPKE